MVAGTLNHGNGSRVAHAEAFTHLSVDIELTAGGTIKSCIACNDVVFGFIAIAPAGRWQNRDAATTESLAEIVVGLTFQTDIQPFHGESAKALTCRSLELNLDCTVGQSFFTVFLGDNTTEHRTHGTIGILDGVVERDFLSVVYRCLCIFYNFLIQNACHVGVSPAIPVECLFP